MPKTLRTKGKPTDVFEVIVIGGGPAGMMAAIEAGKRGKSVLLLEKNSGLGKKLLITGGGRCNVTNNKPVVRDMLSQYKKAGKFLYSTFMQYGVKETIDFFNVRGLPFKEENEGRLFPVTDSAASVHAVLEKELRKNNITIKTNSCVTNVTQKDTLFTVTVGKEEHIKAVAVVIAAGGMARPETGSRGDAWPWLTALGHTVQAGSTALVPISIKETWAKALSGVSLPEATINIYCEGKKRLSVRGKLLFTHVGLSGPVILNQSKAIGDMLVEGEVIITIDCAPTIDASVIQAELLFVCMENPNKKVKNILATLIKPALVTPLLTSLAIDGEIKAHSLSAKDRKRIGVAFKALPVTITGLLGTDKAVATAGGVDLTEVDFKTMQSNIVPGLYVVGDVLDINRPSGGYSLQLCWTTGAVAGRSV